MRKFAFGGFLLCLCACAFGQAPSTPSDVAPWPQRFLKRALVEYHTALWCSACVQATDDLLKLEDTYGGRIISIAYHSNDKLTFVDTTPLDQFVGGVFAYPTGAVDRLSSPSYDKNGILNMSTGKWAKAVRDTLMRTPTFGLRIQSALAGSVAKVTILVAPRSSFSRKYSLTAVVVQNGIVGFPQPNGGNDVPLSRYYGKGPILKDYVHNHVLRQFLTPQTGAPLDAPSRTNELQAKTYTFSIWPLADTTKLRIVAFVHETGATLREKVVDNCQAAALGADSGW